MTLGRRALLRCLALSAAAAAACVRGPAPTRPDPSAVRVYTSLYPPVIEAIRSRVDAQLAAAEPGMKVVWVQGGSSRLRRKLDAELASRSGSPADVLLTSDPSHYRELASQGRLVPYASKTASTLPAEARAADHSWVTARYSVMVIGVVPGKPKVASFDDLRRKVREGGVSIGDPEFSGTNLVTAARLSDRLGWEFFEALKARDAVVAGDNSTVIERLETATADAGIVLLENVLAAKARGAKVEAVYPKEGAIVVPGPIALLPHARVQRGATAVYDAILSPEVQAILVEEGFLHAADPTAPPPRGSPPLVELLGGAPLASAFAPIDAGAVKSRFAALFAREAVATPSPSPSPQTSPTPAGPLDIR